MPGKCLAGFPGAPQEPLFFHFGGSSPPEKVSPGRRRPAAPALCKISPAARPAAQRPPGRSQPYNFWPPFFAFAFAVAVALAVVIAVAGALAVAIAEAPQSVVRGPW